MVPVPEEPQEDPQGQDLPRNPGKAEGYPDGGASVDHSLDCGAVGFMAMFSAMAEDERARIIKRTHEGRKIAQGRGVKMGRKEKLNEKQKAAHKRLAAGEVPNDLALRRQPGNDRAAALVFS